MLCENRMAAAAKEVVLQLVPKLAELELLEVCAGLNLKLSDKPRKDRKTALYNMLVRHITSEEIEEKEEAEQLAIFGKLGSELQLLLHEKLGEDGDEDAAKAEELEEAMLQKLQELKEMAGMGGSTGGGGGSGKQGLVGGNPLSGIDHIADYISKKSYPEAAVTKTEDRDNFDSNNTNSNNHNNNNNSNNNNHNSTKCKWLWKKKSQQTQEKVWFHQG